MNSSPTLRTFASLFALALPCCTRAHTPPTTTPPVEVTPANTSHPEPVAASIPPSANPEGFEADTRAEDVDQDGLVDRVRPIPDVPRAGATPVSVGNLPPALVAHRLPDGRYAVDDDVTRAALRALCPDPPPAIFTLDATPTDDEAAPDRRARALYLDAFCALAWGRSIDAVGATMRQSLAAFDAGVPGIPPPLVDAMLGALRRVHFSFVMRPMTGEFPSTGPASTGAPATPASAPDPSTPVAVPPGCLPVSRATEGLRARAVREAARRPRPESASPLETTLTDTRRCAVTPGGTWALRFTSLEWGRAEDQAFRGRMEVAFTSSPPAAPWRPFALPLPWSQGTFQSQTYAIEELFDWDGDGRAEAAVRAATWEHEGVGANTLAIYSARDQAVVAYPQAASLGAILSLQDADHDGRRDLELPTRWSFTDGCGMAGITHAGPTLLAHALPNGTFSTDDEVARSWLTRACERAAQPDSEISEAARDIRRVVCARAWGASPDRIVGALRREHARRPRFQPSGNDQEVCYPFQDLAALALIAPPFAPRAVAP